MLLSSCGSVTVVGVLCLLVVSAGAAITQGLLSQEYEWAQYGALPHYAQGTAFSLLSFTVPPLTVQAQFFIGLTSPPTGRDDTKVLFSLRRAAIPVLQALNETLPDSYVLPSDQQTSESANQTRVILTLNSPAPGRVYLASTLLNPIAEVIDFLRWQQEMTGDTTMSVMAVYTLRTSVPYLSVNETSTVRSTSGQTRSYSFRVPGFTMSYSVNIGNCRQDGTSSNCTMTVTVADSLASNDTSSVSVDCRHQQGSRCQLTVPSPTLEQDHYITFALNNSTGQSHNFTFDVGFDVQDCQAMSEATEHSAPSDALPAVRYALDQRRTMSRLRLEASVPSNSVASAAYRRQASNDQLERPLCVNQGYLGRRSHPSKETSFSFNAEFGLRSNINRIIPDFKISVPDFTTDVRTFSLQESLDSGGDLYLGATLQNKTWEGMVWVCVMPHRLAQNGSVDSCVDGALLTLNASEGFGNNSVYDEAFLHFPSSGPWYISMQSQCRGAEACEALPVIRMSVRLVQCSPNCGKYGYCQIYTDVNLVFAGCDCFAGYRGLLCNDNTHSLSDSDQLRAVYLLTLSNLAFLPAIFLAVYRRYFILAAIFFFNCFFSTFYHACDSSSVFQKCIMDYNTLSFCDFFGSMLSFYSLLLYMARVPESCRTFLLMAGTLVLAVFQNSMRHNDVAHVVPIAVAGCILLVSWVVVMRRRRKLFPSRRRYLLYIVPGLVLALTGIGVNYGLMWHKATYQYTHSFWHMSLMLATCFLLPPAAARKSTDRSGGLSISAQDIIRAGDQEQDDGPAMFDASMNSINIDQQNRLI